MCDIKIAVGIEGELALLEQTLKALERVQLMVSWLAQRRGDVEDQERDGHEVWLSHSERCRRLEALAEQLDYDVGLLEQAMRDGVTIDDGIPF